MSFIECTAQSMRPVEQRLLDLLGEQALAADLRQRAILHRVAGGLDDGTISTASGPAQIGWAAARRRAPSAAWTSASGLPRVPMRSGMPCWHQGARDGPCGPVQAGLGRRRARARQGPVRANGQLSCPRPVDWRQAMTYPADPRHRNQLRRDRRRDGRTTTGRCSPSVVLSQLAEHRPYGGVVPEIAARSHLDHLDGLIAEAMRRAGLRLRAISTPSPPPAGPA